jgi:hypothetical protein
MYVKRAKTKDANSSMIVMASFNSMVSPPFDEGKPCPPKVQLYKLILPQKSIPV